jgi:hypothetical protein
VMSLNFLAAALRLPDFFGEGIMVLSHYRPTGISDFRAKKAVRLRASDLPQGRV